jgi:hypothetical protein
MEPPDGGDHGVIATPVQGAAGAPDVLHRNPKQAVQSDL